MSISSSAYRPPSLGDFYGGKFLEGQYWREEMPPSPLLGGDLEYNFTRFVMDCRQQTQEPISSNIKKYCAVSG